jgi:shikimate dehydrogenase
MRQAGVIGHPIRHSRSPLIHGHWLDRHGISGTYERFEVTPDQLPAFIASMADRGLAGVNVTIPHKEATFGLVDRLTSTASVLGAVNTLWFEHGELWGDNTDVEGFMAHLDLSSPSWSSTTSRALVIGAGGAARAVVYGLALRGVPEIFVMNRTLDRAMALAAQFGASVHPGTLPVSDTLLASVDLIVNTTSLGMHGQPPLDLPLASLKQTALVADIVYVPLVTPLLQAARARRLETVDGLGMLLHQAASGFERWFGVRPKVTPDLRALIEADIEGHST